MKSKYGLYVCIAIVLIAAICRPSFAAQATGEIRGRITNASGGPVAGATVLVRPLTEGGGATLTSGADGTYRAAALPAGLYQVVIAAAGYTPSTAERVRVADAPVVLDRVLEITGTVEHIAVIASGINTDAGRLTGTVTDKSGKPLPFAWVSIRSSVIGPPTFQQTDRDGKFDVPSLPVGLYTLRAAAGGYETVTRYPTITSNAATTTDIALWSSADVLGRPLLAAVSVRAGEWLLSLESALGRTLIAMDGAASTGLRQAVDAHVFDGARIVAIEKEEAARELQILPAGAPAGSTLRFEQPIGGDVRLTYRNETSTGRIVDGADVLLEVPPMVSEAGPRGAPVISMASIRPAGPGTSGGNDADVAVTIDTALGRIVLALDAGHAPITTANFLKYVDAGLFNGGRFHRATRPDNYAPSPPNRPAMQLIQGGINPSRAAEGFPAIPLERTSATGLTHVAGIVSMARGTAADTAKSDFFILLDDQPSLDFGGKRFDDAQGAAAFGRVIAGLDVVRAIQQQPVTQQNLTPPVAIVSITRGDARQALPAPPSGR